MAGFAARRARLISESTKATTMPAMEPTNRVTTKQTAPIRNSDRSVAQSSRNSLMPSSGRIATPTIAPIAGDGMSASSAVPKTAAAGCRRR